MFTLILTCDTARVEYSVEEASEANTVIIEELLSIFAEICGEREVVIDADADEPLPESLESFLRERGIKVYSEEELEKALEILEEEE